MNPRSVAVSTALLSVLAVGGCSSSTEGTSGATGAAGTSPGLSASETPNPQPTDTATGQPASSGGGCSLIDAAAAEQILGAAATGTPAQDIGENGGITKVDGCSYEAAGSNLGYDVLVFQGMPADKLLASGKSRMKAAMAKDPSVKEFSSGLDNSIAFTFPVGNGVDSEVFSLVGDNWVSVAVSRQDGDKTITEPAATAAAQAIAAAL